MVSLKRCQNSIGQNSSIMMHFQEWKKGLLTQFTVVTLCTKGFSKFHQHKMTIENNFITNDKIDTCPAFHLIYLLQSLQMLTNTHYQWQWVYEAYPILCIKKKLHIKVAQIYSISFYPYSLHYNFNFVSFINFIRFLDYRL